MNEEHPLAKRQLINENSMPLLGYPEKKLSPQIDPSISSEDSKQYSCSSDYANSSESDQSQNSEANESQHSQQSPSDIASDSHSLKSSKNKSILRSKDIDEEIVEAASKKYKKRDQSNSEASIWNSVDQNNTEQQMITSTTLRSSLEVTPSHFTQTNPVDATINNWGFDEQDEASDEYATVKQSIGKDSHTQTGSETVRMLTLSGMLNDSTIVSFCNTNNFKETGISHHILILKKKIDEETIEYCIGKLTTNEKSNQHHLKKLAKNKFPITDMIYCGELEDGSRILYGFTDDKNIFRLCEMKIDANLLRTVVSIPVSPNSALPCDSRRIFMSYCGKYIHFRETDTRIAVFPKDAVNHQTMINITVRNENEAQVKKVIMQGKEYEADILSEDLLYLAAVHEDSTTVIHSVSKSAETRKTQSTEKVMVQPPTVLEDESLEMLDVYFLPAYNLLVYLMTAKNSGKVFAIQYFLKFDEHRHIIGYKQSLTVEVDSSFFTKPSSPSFEASEQPSEQLQTGTPSYSSSLLRDELLRTANIFVVPQTAVHRILKLNFKFDKDCPTPIVSDHMKIEISSDKLVGQLNIGSYTSDQSGQSKRVCAFPITDRPNCLLLLKK